ncbi:MAG: hypothetical protein IJ827_04625 [Lachnospiraceae bacterium]|nr:hypothetical protein [Lachnospiraceae bacterium]
MSPIIGNIIVIAAVILLVAVCLKQIIGEMKGGGCAGCSGGCSACGQKCGSHATEDDKVNAAKAAEILKGIRAPKHTEND